MNKARLNKNKEANQPGRGSKSGKEENEVTYPSFGRLQIDLVAAGRCDLGPDVDIGRIRNPTIDLRKRKRKDDRFGIVPLLVHSSTLSFNQPNFFVFKLKH